MLNLWVEVDGNSFAVLGTGDLAATGYYVYLQYIIIIGIRNNKLQKKLLVRQTYQ